MSFGSNTGCIRLHRKRRLVLRMRLLHKSGVLKVGVSFSGDDIKPLGPGEIGSQSIGGKDDEES